MGQTGLLELNAIVAVSTHKSFRRAAAELGLSPSALSHAVANLEKRLGARLFNRTTRSVSLSEAGERFLARIRPALRDIEAAIAPVSVAQGDPVGTLRINASEYSARHALGPVVLEFLRRYPHMRIEIVTTDAMVDLVSEGFDAAFCLADEVPKDMVQISCGQELRFVVVATPSYFEGKMRPKLPTELLGHNCIRRRMESGAIYRWEFHKGGEEIVLGVPGTLTLDKNSLIVEAALAGAGIAYLNRWWVAGHLAVGRLETVLEDWINTTNWLLAYPPGRHVSAGLRAFAELVRSANFPTDGSPKGGLATRAA